MKSTLSGLVGRGSRATRLRAQPGPAVNAAMMDLGDRFRLLINEVDAVPPDQAMPKLPVARALVGSAPELADGGGGLDPGRGGSSHEFCQALDRGTSGR